MKIIKCVAEKWLWPDKEFFLEHSFITRVKTNEEDKVNYLSGKYSRNKENKTNYNLWHGIYSLF